MNRARSSALVVAGAMLLVGCTDRGSVSVAPASAWDAVSVELDAARERWAAAGIGSYRVTVTERVNYWSSGCTWVTEVEVGVVTTSRAAAGSERSTCPPLAWTVEEMHTQVATMISDVQAYGSPEEGRDTLEVTFDANGVPTSIEFDVWTMNDEESAKVVTFTELGA